MAAEAVVGATIQILLEKLLTFSTEQVGLVRNFKNDLKKLQKTICLLKAFLQDAEEKQVTAHAVKRWLGELEALAFEADNVFDEINYRLLSKKVGATGNKTLKRKVQSFFLPSSYRLKLGSRIKDINEKLKSINQEARDLGLQEKIAAEPPACASASRQTDSFSKDPIFLGREEEVSSIVGTLITTTERELSVLPIVGMGGLGKTTLVRKVFNHEQIKSHFGDKQRVWVHVPRTFDDSVLLERILTSMKIKDVERGNREALLKTLQEHLGAKKYLLILDDVWNEDRKKWDDFVNSLSGISSATGNCIIVTTRSETVGSIVGTLSIHKLKQLSKDDCWSIIKARAFREGDDPFEFEALEAAGKNVAEKCRGSPLAANLVGGLLVGKSKDEWMSIEKNWLSDLGDENPITKILKMSLDNLSSPSLKKCFAYCSIFPKGYQIKKERLVELWMAEGFLQTLDGNRVFNLLLQSSLFQVAKRNLYGNITHCNMHDHVHDLANSVLCENDNITDGVFQRRYIGYKPSRDGFLSIPEGQERYVRTLFFNGKISDIRFSDFESLRTLTLENEEDIDDLPNSIRKLKHLRYLDISGTRIKSLSDSIGELYHLQTLRANYYDFKRLPNCLSCLVSLRNLHISRTTTLPPEIGKLTSLQILPYFHVRSEKGYGISELGNLKNLKGKLKIHNLENVRDKNEAMSGGLSQKSGIYELWLVWDTSREGEKANDVSVLEGLQPHSNLKILRICGFKGESLSLWEGINNLVEIKLEKLSECEELPMLGHLPYLKHLYLDGLTKVTSIRSSFYENIDNCKRDAIIVLFRALERLTLQNMSNLKEWDEIDLPSPDQVFPRLKYLFIYKCKQLTRAPSHFPCLEELEIYGMESSLALENICGIKLTSLRYLIIRKIEGLECFPYWLFSNNHNLTELYIHDCPKMTHLVPCLLGGGGAPPSLLRELRIWNCPSLKELPNDLHSLSSLETLYIRDCPELKSIPYPVSSGGGQQQQQQSFTSLGELRIEDCSGLTNLPIEMVESCAKSLEVLKLSRLSSINNFPMVIGCLHRMTRLRKLDIMQVPKFSSKDIIGSLSLQHLTMGPSSDSSWNDVFFNETLGAILLPQSIISLRKLRLWGKVDWDSLPNQLQHLTSLEYLHIYDFGIEALPEWFGNLSSLKELCLYHCKKLRHLPSKQAMQRLSTLTLLNIKGCPLLLKEENRSNNNNEVPQVVDSEWPNISHISRVYVDDHLISFDE